MLRTECAGGTTSRSDLGVFVRSIFPYSTGLFHWYCTKDTGQNHRCQTRTKHNKTRTVHNTLNVLYTDRSYQNSGMYSFMSHRCCVFYGTVLLWHDMTWIGPGRDRGVTWHYMMSPHGMTWYDTSHNIKSQIIICYKVLYEISYILTRWAVNIAVNKIDI